MPQIATPPFTFGYYLEVISYDQTVTDKMILWERTLDPMAWSVDEVQWCFLNNNDWLDTLQTDDSMQDKTLIKLG